MVELDDHSHVVVDCALVTFMPNDSGQDYVSVICNIHASWYLRVSGTNPVLKIFKGFFSIFEYSIPLHAPLRSFVQYWGTLVRNSFPILSTLKYYHIFSMTSLIFAFLANE